jgi:hypothetical protein
MVIQIVTVVVYLVLGILEAGRFKQINRDLGQEPTFLGILLTILFMPAVKLFQQVRRNFTFYLVLVAILLYLKYFI